MESLAQEYGSKINNYAPNYRNRVSLWHYYSAMYNKKPSQTLQLRY